MRRSTAVRFCFMFLAAMALLPDSGVTAAPRARLAYWVMADLVRGNSGAVGAAGVQTNVFKQGEEVVFRARVLDIATGQDPGQQGKGLKAIQELGLKVIAYLEDGQSFPMTYGQHPAQAQSRGAMVWFWSAAWKIPAAYSAPHEGAELLISPKDSRWVKWWVVVTDKAGTSLRFDPIGTGTALPPTPIIIEKR